MDKRATGAVSELETDLICEEIPIELSFILTWTGEGAVILMQLLSSSIFIPGLIQVPGTPGGLDELKILLSL